VTDRAPQAPGFSHGEDVNEPVNGLARDGGTAAGAARAHGVVPEFVVADWEVLLAS